MIEWIQKAKNFRKTVFKDGVDESKREPDEKHYKRDIAPNNHHRRRPASLNMARILYFPSFQRNVPESRFPVAAGLDQLDHFDRPVLRNQSHARITSDLGKYSARTACRQRIHRLVCCSGVIQRSVTASDYWFLVLLHFLFLFRFLFLAFQEVQDIHTDDTMDCTPVVPCFVANCIAILCLDNRTLRHSRKRASRAE